jgi:hypothetical protein
MKSLKLMLTCHLNPIKSRFFGPIQSSLEIQVTAPSTSPATVSRPMIPSRQQRGVAPDQEAWSLLELFPPSVTKLYTYNFPNIAGYNWLHVIIYIYTYIHTYIYITKIPFHKKDSTHSTVFFKRLSRCWFLSPPASAVAPHWLSTASAAPPSVRRAKRAAAPATWEAPGFSVKGIVAVAVEKHRKT